MPTFGSLFAGIGGLDLGLERAGWTCRWQVERDAFCSRVLAAHWPHVARYGDIEAVDPQRLEPVELVCGGFPCQPVSLAGKGLAQDDERWLWPEFGRIVRALRPRYVLVENVPGLLGRGLGEVLGGLAASGYDAEWDCLPAASVGAPHLRDRVWIVAYPHGGGLVESIHTRERRTGMVEAQPSRYCGSGEEVEMSHAERDRLERLIFRRPAPGTTDRSLDGPDPSWWEIEPDVGRVAHGVPARVDRLRALGNAVVPQVAEWIGRRLIEAMR